MVSNLIICTVGTSLLQKKTDGRRQEFPPSPIIDNILSVLSHDPSHILNQKTIEEELSEESGYCHRLFNVLMDLTPNNELVKRGKKDYHKDPDLLPAELSSIYLYYWHDNNIPSDGGDEINNGDIVVFLHSETNEGIFCACCLKKYLEEKEPLKSKISEVKIIGIEGLQTKDTKKFEETAILKLSEILKKEIESGHKKDYNVVLNITGGYKGTIPYLTLFGMLYQGGEDTKERKVSIKYLYEDSKEVITLPNLPVAFDIFMWRNYRGFVKAMPHLEATVAESFLENILPTQIGGLFEKVENKYRLTTLGMTLDKKYNDEKDGELTPYGRGYLLTDKINDDQKRKALQDCIDRWQYLWLGDLIPETVEHARGHTQRVLELAAQILYPILDKEGNFFGDENQTNKNLIALISAIWLHDLGHSGDYLLCKTKDGILQDVGTDDDDTVKIQRDIKGFPSMVRGMHHLLSWYLIGKDRKKLFASGHNDVRDPDIFSGSLIEDIRRIGLYHRGKMPVLENPANHALKNYEPYNYSGIEIKEPLENLRSTDADVKLPLLGALLRIADGGDVQEERTISTNYEAMRKLQSKRDIERLEKEEKKYRNILFKNSLFSQSSSLYTLKKIAEDHFNGESSNQNKCSDEMINLVEKCVQDYIRGADLENSDLTKELILHNWLSVLDQYVFKKSPDIHFKKHRGISAVMYRLDEKVENGKNEYHFKVLAIHKEGAITEKTGELIENAKRVLKDIFCEYKKVEKILNDHRIYFDSCGRQEEGSEEIIPVPF